MRPNMYKALKNTGWLFFDRLLRMGAGLLVGVWIARYLGPEQFGQLSFATALISMGGAIAGLGLNPIVVRDLLARPNEANVTLGSSFALQLVGGAFAWGVGLLAVGFLRPGDRVSGIMIAVLGLTLLCKATDVVRYWFESRVASHAVVLVENGIFLAVVAVKAVLILIGANLMGFVWVTFAESLLVAVGLLFIYGRYGGPLKAWRVNTVRVWALLKDSWPLFLSGIAIIVYMRIDQIMIGQMMGDGAVGVYSAAVKVSEVWYFIPTAIVASVNPYILAAKQQDGKLYEKRLQTLYKVMVALGLLVALPMTFLSPWVIDVLFGASYASAAPALSLHIWSAIFVFLGVASSSGYLAENLQMFALWRTLLGAIVNVVANLALIPIFGVVGAAAGTLLAQIISTFAFDAFHVKTRSHFRMKFKSFFFFLD